MTNKTKALSLRKGDILVIQRGFNAPPDWSSILQQAGKEAGIDFTVPVIFVDSLDEIGVVRMGENASLDK